MGIEMSETTRSEARIIGAVVGLGALLALLIVAAPHSPENVPNMPTGPIGQTSMTHGDEIWSPSGQPVAMPASALRAIGRTKYGDTLYVEAAPRGGGGGGGGNVGMTPPDKMYIRTLDGRYQPLTRSSFMYEFSRPR